MVKVIEKIGFEPDLSYYRNQVVNHCVSQSLEDMTRDGFVSMSL